MRDGRIVQVGTPEEILTDPANDYVAQFVQDVDRARVLTAASAMEPARALVSNTAGPRAALREMRDLQTSAAFVVGRGRTLIGAVRDREVMRLVKNRTTELEPAIDTEVAAVTGDIALADLYEVAVENDLPIAVIDDKRRLLGVIPRVTLLAALGNVDTSNGEPSPVDPPSTIPLSIITETLRESADGGNADDSAVSNEGVLG
jgi:glycine betaine/proline transport system ATP-binding protein